MGLGETYECETYEYGGQDVSPLKVKLVSE